MISRRLFLALTGTTILSSPASWATNAFPESLDHIILGCNNLNDGIAFVEKRMGVRAALGGVHPDRGTTNALLSLGERHYLEILAPDPAANVVQPWAIPQLTTLKKLTTPRLITWAAHTGDIDALAIKLRESGIAIVGPRPGSRTRPDGSVVRWKTFNLADDHHGLFPFFIEWNPNSVHPSLDAPQGCNIESFAAADQNPGELSKVFQLMEVVIVVENSEKPQLRAKLSGPKSILKLSS